MKNIFYVDELKDLINQYNNKQITIGKLTELLNGKAQLGFSDSSKLCFDAKKSNVFSRDECVFKYCPNADLCKQNCINTD